MERENRYWMAVWTLRGRGDLAVTYPECDNLTSTYQNLTVIAVCDNSHFYTTNCNCYNETIVITQAIRINWIEGRILLSFPCINWKTRISRYFHSWKQIFNLERENRYWTAVRTLRERRYFAVTYPECDYLTCNSLYLTCHFQLF